MTSENELNTVVEEDYPEISSCSRWLVHFLLWLILILRGYGPVLLTLCSISIVGGMEE